MGFRLARSVPMLRGTMSTYVKAGMSWFSIADVLILRCVSSSTRTSLIGPMNPRSHEPTLGSRMLSMVNLTSSAVSFSPLWNVTPPGRAITRLVLLSVQTNDLASLGLTWKVTGSW